MENCSLYNEHHWQVYEAQFYLVSFLTIHILQGEEYKFELRDFVKTLLSLTYSYDYQYILTVKVRESFLSEKQNISRKFIKTPSPSHLDNLNLHANISNEKFWKVKRLLSDSLEGHLIIAWDVNIVHQYLDENHRRVIPETRATYAFMFFASQCEMSNFHNFLRRLWIEYHVANVIAQTPCSCNNTRIYMYRPFFKADDTWGVTTDYTLEEIVNHFRLISNPLTNFNHFPFNVSIFPRVPTALETLPKLLQYNPIYKNLSWSKNFAGSDGMILGTLAKFFNFDVILPSKLIEDDFGEILSNGSITGSLGDIVGRKADFNANGRLLAFFFLKEIEFTIPYTKEDVCVVVPKAGRIPRWKLLFTCLDLETWFCIIFTGLVCVIFWFNIGPTSDFSEVFYHVYSYLVGIPIRSVPRNTSRTFFVVPCMIYSIVVLGMVQGSFYRSLTIPHYYEDINTLQEVIDTGIPIAGYLWFLFKNDSDLIRKLYIKSVDSSVPIFDLVAYKRNMFAIDTRVRLELMMKSKYVDEDGNPLLHVVNECLTTFLTANIVPTDSPFLPTFNNVIIKLFESGLISKWNKDVFDGMVDEQMFAIGKKGKKLTALSLRDTRGVFYIMFLGLTCSLLAFLFEILYKMKVEKYLK